MEKKKRFNLISYFFGMISCVVIIAVVSLGIKINRNMNLSIRVDNVQPEFTLYQMLGDTPYIVKGKVLNISLYEKRFPNVEIHSDVSFLVEESYNNNIKAGDTITIIYYKSEDGSVDSYNDLTLKKNEKLLLFLDTATIESKCKNKHYFIKGDSQGKFQKIDENIYESQYYDNPLTIDTTRIMEDITFSKKKLLEMEEDIID